MEFFSWHKQRKEGGLKKKKKKEKERDDKNKQTFLKQTDVTCKHIYTQFL